MRLQQIEGQRHQLIFIGDCKYFEERRHRPDFAGSLEFQGRRGTFALDLAGVFVDDKRGLSLDPAITQRLLRSRVGVQVERIIVHGLAGRAEAPDRKRRKDSQLLDCQSSALSFTPHPR